MQTRHIAGGVFRRYLDLLELEAVPVTAEGLERLVFRHVLTAPFENISKRAYARRGASDIPDLAAYLDDIRLRRLGGTCFANNYHLHSLLIHVGFDARICGAAMGRHNDAHLALMVSCANREFLVDAGFGAPFLAPIPTDAHEPQVFPLGDERWVVHPRDTAGLTRVEYQSDGKTVYAYALDPRPRAWQEFRGPVAASFGRDAHFMNTVRIIRYLPDGCLRLENQRLTRYFGNMATTETIPAGELTQCVVDAFGIPAPVVREALGGNDSDTR